MEADQLDPASYQLLVESGQLQHSQPCNTNEAAQLLLDMSVNQQQFNTSTTLLPPAAQAPARPLPPFVAFYDLGPVQQEALDLSAWYNCASPYCQRQMVLKPWTRFHATTLEALCTECTRVLLRDPGLNTDIGALEHLENQVLIHRDEKKRRQEYGSLQNPDDDAPFDYPASMRGPIALTDYAPIAAKVFTNVTPQIVSTVSTLPNNASNDVVTPVATAHEPISALHDNTKTAPDTSTTEEAKPSRWSSMFKSITNTFTRSPPKPSSSNAEARSLLQSPAYNNNNAVIGPSLIMQTTIGSDDAAYNTTANTDADSDFDTNIDDLIDEDSFAAEPNRVRNVAVAQDEGNYGDGDDDDDDDSEGQYEEAEQGDEEMMEQREDAEYHAAMVEGVKVHDDTSDEEYMDD